jgi:tRNA (guanine37-N1)-methyltransferase
VGAAAPPPEAEALTRARRPDLWSAKASQKRPKNTTDG